MLNLDQLAAREPACVVGYDSAMPRERRERLEDLGLIPETPVTCERRAPLGDPLVLRVRGTLLCLRRAEARLIRVRRTGNP